MKKLTYLVLLALTAALKLSSAAEPAATTETQPPAPPAVEPKLEIKNKSSFVMDESGRNPFWPIGWKPAAKATSNSGSGPEVRPTAFLVSSITLEQGARYAIINGKVMSEGQVFGLQMGSQTYQITVKAIQDGQVILARRDQEIVVPLRRR